MKTFQMEKYENNEINLYTNFIILQEIINYEEITCQLSFFKKITGFFFINYFNKFVRKFSCNIRIFSSAGRLTNFNSYKG